MTCRFWEVSFGLLRARSLVDLVYYSLQIFESLFATGCSIDEGLANCINGEPDTDCRCEDRLLDQVEFVGIFNEPRLQVRD